MEYKEFLTRLGETALRYAELPEGSEDISEEINDLEGLGKNVVQTLQFDKNGDWTYSNSFYCPLNLDMTASISDAPSDTSFDIVLDTNYSQHFAFHDKHSGDSVSFTMKTNIFSKTKITFKIHCSRPNSSAKLHLSINY